MSEPQIARVENMTDCNNNEAIRTIHTAVSSFGMKCSVARNKVKSMNWLAGNTAITNTQ